MSPGLPGGLLKATSFAFLVAPCLLAQEAAEPISDNSFLIEEAYNQDPGVVQHIGTFARADGGDAWDASLAQEWPFRGRRHQLSYTVPLAHADGSGFGVGDVALNYRYQLAGADGSPLFVSPRVSALLPTGSEEDGRGSGELGVQANLPVSYVPVPAVAIHWNAGVTVAGTTSYNLGASAVWHLRPRVNLLLETVWFRDDGAESAFLNPGIRWAHDAGNLQVVPGVAYTVGIGPSAGEDGVFLYLSFEHPFSK